MIEKEVIKKKLKEFEIMEYIENVVDKPGYGFTEIQRTPLGEKVTIHTSKPGLVVGRKGASIRELTEILKSKFNFENPQIEVSEITDPNLNPHSVAKYITHTFQRFGPGRFKFLGYKLLDDIMKSGAVGAEIVLSGRGIPSTRAKSWRFSAGHLKKSGDISENHMRRGFAIAHLKSGAIGVKVSILTPDIKLPDDIDIYEPEVAVEEVTEQLPPEEVVKEIKEKIKEEPEVEKVPKSKEKKELKKTTEDIPKKESKKPKKEEKVPTAKELAKKKEIKDGNNKKE
ncbi:30S ribosomal protein S3 [Candidatus Woesearchaeota archaeon]|jgi:small subunit ribosomal protein S3|nr:30S ribosomal protein S3 [Candidatus Woesearchaeota archaeon]MBT4321734.1 30S ribosomal protein S3 [Candidatus Woesearchaeota archaeon]MBT4631174.1 30S ribosomal protein S3 [Candidatus Woesearchaeota archaeon]